VLLINGSCVGNLGNSAELLSYARRFLEPKVEISSIDLYQNFNFSSHQSEIERSDGFVFATGTYWDSWGSPLQHFLEEATASEGAELWLGKPAAVLVSMHAVGGKGVLSRLQGVLNTFGLSIPPMSGVVYSYVNKLAIQACEPKETQDLWRPADIEIVCHNLVEAMNGSTNWQSWPVDSENFAGKWM
jgi:chromate reductase